MLIEFTKEVKIRVVEYKKMMIKGSVVKKKVIGIQKRKDFTQVRSQKYEDMPDARTGYHPL